MSRAPNFPKLRVFSRLPEGSTTALSVGSHSLQASYSGDANFQASSATLAQKISYGICALYDQTRSVNGGATFPIKLYLCDANGNDVSSSTIVVHATAVTNVSGYAGPVESPGNAYPDNDFRYDSTQGPTGGYTFNLGTTGLVTGTYSLQFKAGADPTTHSVNFGVKQRFFKADDRPLVTNTARPLFHSFSQLQCDI